MMDYANLFVTLGGIGIMLKLMRDVAQIKGERINELVNIKWRLDALEKKGNTHAV